MARHSGGNRASKIKRNVAVSASAALAVAPFAFFQAPGYAADAETCEAINDEVPVVREGFAVAEYVDNAVCQLIFTDVTEQQITIPAGVSKISVFAVGGGAGSFVDDGAYGGSGGQVVVIDDLESGAEIPAGGRTYTLQAGSGSDHSGSGSNAGSASTIKLDGVTKLSASGGLAYGSSKPFSLNGTAHAESDYVGSLAVLNDGAGAGTAADFVSQTVGGPGYSIGDAIAGGALDSDLWGAANGSGTPGDGSELSEFSIQYSSKLGLGGNYDGDTEATLGTLGYGAGGSINANASSALDGEDGVIIMRFALDSTSYTVTFNSNGGSSVDDGTFVEDGDVSEPADPSKDGYTFVGWSTTLDDSETEVSFPYSPGVTEAITLYALWTEEASTGRASGISYEGPSGIRQTSSGTCVGDLTTITGSRLGTIQNIYVDGTDVPFTLVSDSQITFNIPNMDAGTYQLKYWVPVNNVNLTDRITIGACSVDATEPETELGSGELSPFYVAKRFTSYRGDRGAIVAADREAITAFIAANPGLTHITCVGSTSGQPASPTDQALAMARAENACAVVENLVPGITTRMVTSTGRGVGQFYRAVTLFGKGQRPN